MRRVLPWLVLLASCTPLRWREGEPASIDGGDAASIDGDVHEDACLGPGGERLSERPCPPPISLGEFVSCPVPLAPGGLPSQRLIDFASLAPRSLGAAEYEGTTYVDATAGSFDALGLITENATEGLLDVYAGNAISYAVIAYRLGANGGGYVFGAHHVTADEQLEYADSETVSSACGAGACVLGRVYVCDEGDERALEGALVRAVAVEGAELSAPHVRTGTAAPLPPAIDGPWHDEPVTDTSGSFAVTNDAADSQALWQLEAWVNARGTMERIACERIHVANDAPRLLRLRARQARESSCDD